MMSVIYCKEEVTILVMVRYEHVTVVFWGRYFNFGGNRLGHLSGD